MKLNIGKLKVTLPSDREILVTREFNAPRQLVWDAHTKPEMVKRWLYGPEGWSLPLCEIDLRVGGKIRYVWRNVDGREMVMDGVFREVAAPEHFVSTEKFDEAWYPGEAVNALVLTERGGKTFLSLTLSYESKVARDMALKSGMNDGLELGYSRLEVIFRSPSRLPTSAKGRKQS